MVSARYRIKALPDCAVGGHVSRDLALLDGGRRERRCVLGVALLGIKPTPLGQLLLSRTVANADKVVVLDSGRVVEQGTPVGLMERDGLFARMVRLQQESAQWAP